MPLISCLPYPQDFISELQTHISSHLLDISICTSPKHLKLKMSKAKLNSQPPPLTESPGCFLVSPDAVSGTPPFTQLPRPGTWESSGTPPFPSSSYPTQPTRSVDSIQISLSLHLHYCHHPDPSPVSFCSPTLTTTMDSPRKGIAGQCSSLAS